MTRFIQSLSSRIALSGVSVVIMVFLALHLSPVAWGAPICLAGDCSGGEVCVSTQGCVAISMSVNTIVTATTVGYNVDVNGVDPWTLYACLGPRTVCDTKPHSDTNFWKQVGAVDLKTKFAVYNVRPGKTYTASLFVQTDPTTTLEQEATATTWPAFPAPPTISNIGQNTATINWALPFSADSKVRYGIFPQDWQSEYSLPAGQTFSAVAGLSSGKSWAVGQSGAIVNRTISGWQVQNSQTTADLITIDGYDDNSLWVAGKAGVVLRTTNGGGSWDSQSALYSNPADDIYGISTSTDSTAWIAGTQGVHFFDGSLCQTRTPPVSGSFYSVLTLNNHEVWVGGSTGKVYHTINGGTIWTTQNTGGAGTINTLASLDGKTIWAGGANGGLWRSTDSGQTWLTMTTGTAQQINSLSMLSPSEVWFGAANGIGSSTNANGANPTFTFDASVLGAVPSVQSIAFANGSSLIAVGQNKLGAYRCHSSPTSCANVQSDSNIIVPPSSHSVQLNGLSQGQPYFFSVESVGSGVGWGAFGTFMTGQPDTIPPVTAFINPPSPGPTYTNTTPFAVTGTASDTPPGSVQSVTLTKNGTPQSVSGTTSWSSNVALSPGLNALVATATDGGSNTATANSSLFYDATKPVVSITAPTNGSTVNTNPFNVTGTSTDNAANDSGLASIVMTVNGGSPQSIAVAAGTGSFNWNASASLNVGSNTVAVTVADRAGNTQTTQVTFTYVAPSFNLTVTPASQTAFSGDIVTYTATLTSQNGFAGSVNLSAVVAPGGPTVSFSPSVVTLTAGSTATSTLTVATAGANGNTYTITTTATGGSVTKTASVQLILKAAPDFSISATPSPLSIIAGQSGSYTVTVSANNTFAGPITFSVTGIPSNVTGTFSPPSVTLANSQITTVSLNIVTQATAANGDYPLTITGNGTNAANGQIITPAPTTSVILHISPAPDIGLNFTPASQTANAGGLAVVYSGTVTSMNGFGGTGTQVNLTVTSDYAGSGLTMTLQPNQVILASGDVKTTALNVIVANSVPGGTYHLTVTASGGSVTKQATVNLVVNEDTSPPIITNIVPTPNFDRVRITWTTDEPANSAIKIYTDVARANQYGQNETLSTFCTSACHDLVYATLAPLTTYYFTVTSTDTDPTPGGPRTTIATTDASGNPLQFTTLDTPDTTPPDVTLVTPADQTTVTGNTDVTGHGHDDKKVDHIKLAIDNLTPGTTEPPIATTIGCSGQDCDYSYTWNTGAFGAAGNGVHTVTVTAVDGAGNPSSPVTHTVTVDNDFTDPQLTSGPDAINLVCTTTCKITIVWTTDDQSTSEVGYDTPVPQYCDPVSGACTYSQHQAYDDAAPSDSSPAYTSHSVTLTNLNKNVLYHYRVFSCNKTGRCLQSG